MGTLLLYSSLHYALLHSFMSHFLLPQLGLTWSRSSPNVSLYIYLLRYAWTSGNSFLFSLQFLVKYGEMREKENKINENSIREMTLCLETYFDSIWILGCLDSNPFLSVQSALNHSSKWPSNSRLVKGMSGECLVTTDCRYPSLWGAKDEVKRFVDKINIQNGFSGIWSLKRQ